MPELGPMMRALELQRLIEDKVSEWRERSVQVAGGTVADSYQQPLNFKRHTNRRKNSAEINRIIAKYSKPNKRADERYVLPQPTPEITPTRPVRHKKSNLKLSKSEDNLASVSVDLNTHPDPTEIRPPPRGRFKMGKYSAKSYEDITMFVDIHHNNRSKNFEENSILNAKPAKTGCRPNRSSVAENISRTTNYSDSGIKVYQKSNFTTSTPLSKRKTYTAGDSVSVDFEKCSNYDASGIRKGSSEPDLLSVNSIDTVDTSKTINSKKGWKFLKQPFRKRPFGWLLPWRRRGKKDNSQKTAR